MNFEIIENNGLELIGIVKKIEMRKGAEECPAFWKEFSEQLCIPMMQAGKPLNDQEIHNAIYAGPFVSDAKRHFSKTGCAAARLAKDLVPGVAIRQDLLKTALEWMAEHETRGGHPQTRVGYMATHQHDPNANNLWSYFQVVLHWAMTNFDMKRFKRIMKGVD